MKDNFAILNRIHANVIGIAKNNIDDLQEDFAVLRKALVTLDRIMEANHEPEKSGDEAIISHAIECCAAWEPTVRIIGNVRAGDLGRILRKFSTPTPPNVTKKLVGALREYVTSDPSDEFRGFSHYECERKKKGKEALAAAEKEGV